VFFAWCIIATVYDYAAVRDLVADLVAVGVEATVRPEVRDTVNAVAHLIASGESAVRQADLRARLKLDRSTISRRIADAIDRGYLRNLEDKKGRPARLVVGDPLPDEQQVLPTLERLHGCTVVLGDKDPPSRLSCIHCGQPERDHDPILQVADGHETFALLHRHCVKAWTNEYLAAAE
jgi:hypothetical protein